MMTKPFREDPPVLFCYKISNMDYNSVALVTVFVYVYDYDQPWDMCWLRLPPNTRCMLARSTFQLSAKCKEESM